MPDGAGTAAIFPASAAGTVSVSGARTTGNWLIEGSSPYTFNGSGSVTLQQTNQALVSVNGSSGHTVTTPVRLNSDASFYVNASAGLALTGTLSVGSTTTSISKLGAGTLSIPAVTIANLHAGEGRLKINNAGGVTRVTQSLAVGGEMRTSGGTTVFGGAALDLANSGSGLIVDYAVTDLGDGYSIGSPLGTVATQGTLASLIKNSYSGGTWSGAPTDGSGAKLGVITSAAADASSVLAVGYGEASTILGSSGGTFMGATVDATTVLMRVVRYGDANLDGNVNLADFTILSSYFGQTGKRWDHADFNYDGVVNLDDQTLLSANFGMALPGDLPRSNVPEPVAGGLAALASLALLRVRNRRMI